jgi:hypothetical protein
MLKNKMNKRGMGEVFSWAAGLIFIFAIVIISVVIYDVGGVGKRGGVDAAIVAKNGNFYDALNNQRIAVELLTNDFIGGNKGELIWKINSGASNSAFEESLNDFIKFISYDEFFFINNNHDAISETRPGFDLKKLSKCQYVYYKNYKPEFKGLLYFLSDKNIWVSVLRCNNA